MKQPSLQPHAVGQPEQRATRLIFLLCGIGQSAWAPLVPFAKARVHANNQQFGLLLLCFGAGSLLSMPTIGRLTSRYGCKRLIEITAMGLGAALCALSLTRTPWLLAAALVFFGASIGALDVTMNVQGLLVERATRRPLMPGFHAMYSLGSIAGAVVVGVLISFGTPVAVGTMAVVVLLALLLLAARPSLLPYGDPRPTGTTRFSWPGRMIFLIAALAFLFMLAEGAMLDWSAIFLEDNAGVAATHASVGYAAFSIAMTFSRLIGGAIIGRLGRTRVLASGALLAGSGFLLAVAFPRPGPALFAFFLVGVGAANLVPLLFTLASEAKGILATNVSMVTTLGYSGVLAGPALIGFVVHRGGFPAAFGGLGLLMLAASSLTGIAGCGDV